jgi:hypothetical protein
VADNVTFQTSVATPPDATVIATDDVGGAQYQRTKIDGGGDGLSVPIVAGQQLAAGSLPVVLTAAQITTLTPPAAITGFATETTLSALNTKVTAVNTGAVVVSSSALPSGASTSAKQDTQTTLLSGGLPAALGAGGGLKIDGSGTALPVSGTVAVTGSATAANQATQITAEQAIQVAVELIDNAVSGAGFNITQFAGVNAASGSGTATGALRVELPTNGTGVIATVGAVTAITNALPAGTNAIGKLAANTGVDIGDVDVTSVIPGTTATALGKAEDAGHTSGDVGVFALAVRQDTPNTAASATDADYTQISVSSTGAVRTAPPSEDFAALANGPQVKKYYTNAGAVTDGIIWSPAAGKRWYVTDIVVNVSAACTVTFEDDKAGGDEAVAKFEFAANSGWAQSFNTPWFSGEDAADLLITTTAGNVYITITGYEI